MFLYKDVVQSSITFFGFLEKLYNFSKNVKAIEGKREGDWDRQRKLPEKNQVAKTSFKKSEEPNSLVDNAKL